MARLQIGDSAGYRRNDRAEELFQAAAASVAKFQAGDKTGAFDEVSGITDNGEKLFLWAILREFSAVRSFIKSCWQQAGAKGAV